jgi:quercetin dioxygenase-like cupin family protein
MIALVLAVTIVDSTSRVQKDPAYIHATPVSPTLGHQSAERRPTPQRTMILDNAAVTVTRLRFAPGSGETAHTGDVPLVLIQLTAGDLVDLAVRDEPVRGPRVAGLVTFVPAGSEHAVVNAGTTSFEMIAVAIKTTRRPASHGRHSSTTRTCVSFEWSSRLEAASRSTRTRTTS